VTLYGYITKMLIHKLLYFNSV